VVALWVVAFAIGLALQRREDAGRLNRLAWQAYFATIAPAAVLYAYTTVEVDRELVGALAVVAVSSWLLLALAFGYARLAGRTREEQGALVLGAGWGNTVALGYPVAHLLYGEAGLALQVLYAQFYYGVPGIAISASVARLHGLREGPERRRRFRAIAANPPLLAALAAVALRVADVDARDAVEPLGNVVGWASGPAGFLQLGLALPLHRFAHDASDLVRAAGALVLRHAGAPLLVVAVGLAAGVEIPAVFVVGAAAPVAFHTLTLAQVYAVRPDLLRLLVLVSTAGACIVIRLAAALR
jgi:predicted permease